MARDHLGVKRAKQGQVFQRLGKGQINRVKAGIASKGRGAPALFEQGLGDQHCQPRGQKVQRHAGNQLIAFEGDRGKPVQGGEQQRGHNASAKPDPSRACHEGDGGCGHGCGQHLAFQSDVKHARAFGKQARKAGQQQRRAKPDRGAKDLHQGIIIHQAVLFLPRLKAHASNIRTI